MRGVVGHNERRSLRPVNSINGQRFSQRRVYANGYTWYNKSDNKRFSRPPVSPLRVLIVCRSSGRSLFSTGPDVRRRRVDGLHLFVTASLAVSPPPDGSGEKEKRFLLFLNNKKKRQMSGRLRRSELNFNEGIARRQTMKEKKETLCVSFG